MEMVKDKSLSCRLRRSVCRFVAAQRDFV